MPAKAAKQESIPIPNWLVTGLLVLSTIVGLGGGVLSMTVQEPIRRVESRQDKFDAFVLERRQVRDEEYKQTRAELSSIVARLEVLTEIVKRIEANQSARR